MSLTIHQQQAIISLYPQVVTIRGDLAYDKNEQQVTYDLSLVNAWVDPNAYIDKRRSEYPAIGDQLDALFHAGVFPAEMTAQIQAVKDKYPKEQA